MSSVDEKAARKYLALKESSAARGLEFDLPLVSLLNIYKAKKCFYTGVKLTFERGKPNTITLDRVDNDLGYVKGNVVACSAEFNYKKGCLTIKDIRTLYNKTCKD